MPFSLIPRLPTSPPLSRFPTPMPQQLVEKSPRSANSKGLRITVPDLPRTSDTLVRTSPSPPRYWRRHSHLRPLPFRLNNLRRIHRLGSQRHRTLRATP